MSIKYFPHFSLILLLTFRPMVCFAAQNDSGMMQASAMEMGIFLGGSATQYDECVKQGLVQADPQSAEDQVKVYFEASKQASPDKESFEFVYKGWDMAKQQIRQQGPDYWTNNCGYISKQWHKYQGMLNSHN